jgi:hypothetical protein
MGTRGTFPGGKARPGCDADHSPPFNAKVKNEQELYLLSPHAPPWCVAGSLYFLPYRNIEFRSNDTKRHNVFLRISQMSSLILYCCIKTNWAERTIKLIREM